MAFALSLIYIGQVTGAFSDMTTCAKGNGAACVDTKNSAGTPINDKCCGTFYKNDEAAFVNKTL